MTATGIAIRLYSGQRIGDPAVRGGLRTIRGAPPLWPEGGRQQTGNPPDISYWYFGSLATLQVGREAWRKWDRPLHKAIAYRQERRGEASGSWPAPGRWSGIGGRILTTALLAQLLELHHEYEWVFR